MSLLVWRHADSPPAWRASPALGVPAHCSSSAFVPVACPITGLPSSAWLSAPCPTPLMDLNQRPCNPARPSCLLGVPVRVAAPHRLSSVSCGSPHASLKGPQQPVGAVNLGSEAHSLRGRRSSAAASLGLLSVEPASHRRSRSVFRQSTSRWVASSRYPRDRGVRNPRAPASRRFRSING